MKTLDKAAEVLGMLICLLFIWINCLLTPAQYIIRLAPIMIISTLHQTPRTAVLLQNRVPWDRRQATKKFSSRVSPMSLKKGYVVPAEKAY